MHSRARPSSGHSGRRKSFSYHRNSPVNARDLALSRIGHERQTSASSDDGLAPPSFGSNRRPLYAPHRASTLPLTLPAGLDDGGTVSTASSSSVPQAIVVSGLENAGVSAQRALMQVLTNRRIELDEEAYEREGVPLGECGVWHLPPNFILVHVCPINATERPNVLSGLLDNFAISSVVHSHHATNPSLPRSRSRPDIGSSAPFPSSSSKSLQHLQSPSTDPIIPPSEVQHLRSLAASPTLRQPDRTAPYGVAAALPRVRVHTHPSLSLYATDLLSMARHHPELDGTLLTARAHRDVAALLRARRVVHGDSTGGELVREAVEEVNTVLREGTAGEAGTVGGSWEDEALDGGTVHGDWLHIASVRAKGKGRLVSEDDGVQSELTGEELEEDGGREEDEVWEVSDKDVRKVVPKVIQHRVRVRKGPEDHVLGSVLYPAVPAPGQELKEEEWQRRTVEEILVDILEDRDVY